MLTINQQLPQCTTCSIESTSLPRGSSLDCAKLASVTVAAGCLPACSHFTLSRPRAAPASCVDCARLTALSLHDNNMTGTAQGSLELTDLHALTTLRVGESACTCVERLELRASLWEPSRVGIPSLREISVKAGSFANASMLSLTCGSRGVM